MAWTTGSSEGNEKWSDLRYILNGVSTGLVKGLDIMEDRKRRNHVLGADASNGCKRGPHGAER